MSSLLFITLGRILGYISEELSQYWTLHAKGSIPRRNVCEVLAASNIEGIRLASPKTIGDWLFYLSRSYITDIVNLCLICQECKPKIVFEIGTMAGFTALHFALNTPGDTRIYTLDLPKNSGVRPKLETTVGDDILIKVHAVSEGLCFDKTNVASKIIRLFGDSATFDYSDFYGKVGLFFIDGAHSYEYVQSDTLNALKCCYPGSVIAWHDFGRVGCSGVSRRILELSQEYDIYAVPGGSLAFMVINSHFGVDYVTQPMPPVPLC